MIVIPGVPDSTTNGLIPARPMLRSNVAQTTMRPSLSWPARLPLVQKILVPFSTHSFVFGSRRAVVWMALVSDPACGSVIAIAPHLGLPRVKRVRKRSFCSAVPTAWMAAPPRALEGVLR